MLCLVRGVLPAYLYVPCSLPRFRLGKNIASPYHGYLVTTPAQWKRMRTVRFNAPLLGIRADAGEPVTLDVDRPKTSSDVL